MTEHNSMKNAFTIIRERAGRTLKLAANYNEATDDWNVILFEGEKILGARATTDVFAEARDMFELALRGRAP